MTSPDDILSFPTPTNHGDILIWPDTGQIQADVLKNRDRMNGSPIKYGSHTLASWRKKTRIETLRFAQQYNRQSKSVSTITEDDSDILHQPLIVTGHQCGFHHGGILSKYILADALARRLQGLVLNLIVDTDLPKQLELRLPIQTENGLAVKSLPVIEYDPKLPLAYQPLPTEEQIDNFCRSIEQTSNLAALFEPIETVIDTIRKPMDDAVNLTDWLATVNRRLAAPVGLNWLDIPVTQLARSESFLSFVWTCLIRASEFHTSHNRALKDYRLRYKIRNPLQPLPNLAVGMELIEMPFWILSKDNLRRPLFIEAGNHGFHLSDGERHYGAFESGFLEVDSDASYRNWIDFIRERDWLLCPRTLTLTLFARLFLADYFIHGIGGAYYDQVTDELLRHFWDIEPPAFACTSATLHLPCFDEPPIDRLRESLRETRQKKRDVRYNPQRYLNSDPDDIKKRQEAIRESERLRKNRADKLTRRKVFDRIRQLNHEIASKAPEWEKRIVEQERELLAGMKNANIAYDREFFWGLFPDGEIMQLKQNIDSKL